MALPIEDYAVVGDRRTAALVGRDGSIDWLCLPRFDSDACFAALLGSRDNGRWLLAPAAADDVTVTRRYVGPTSLLETTFTTATGTVSLLDAMPSDDQRADLVRRVSGVSGTVRMRHEWLVRFGYGGVRPWVSRHVLHGDEAIVAVAGPDKLVLRGPRLPVAEEGHHVDAFDVTEGEELTWTMTWVASHRPDPAPPDADSAVAATADDDRRWAADFPTDLPRPELVGRSLTTLRLLTHAETGGIVAAPTTSLPEDFGGSRNWDYRFCWLRDASLTLESLLAAGYHEEAHLWRRWLLRAVAGDPEDIQIMYAVDGSRRLTEWELGHLPGYEGSVPVRVGNGAVGQWQTDVLGEVMIALEDARKAGVQETSDSWGLQRVLVDALAERWQQTDHGIWEVRGPQRHFTHSRVMVWVAMDRAVEAVEQHGLDGPVEEWRRVRDLVRQEVLARGFDEDRGTFTQHYDTSEVDASLLVLPLVGFLPGDDPRVLGTIRAVEEDLLREGMVLRYRTQSGVDGLSGDEHPFLACCFWLVSAYAAAGRLEDAEALFERLCATTNDVGLMAEEYDPVQRRMAGNFPQAFSHLTLVLAALDLREARHGREVTRDHG